MLVSLSAEPQFDRLGGRGEGCNTRCPCWRRRLISAAHFAGPSACLNLAPERLSHPTMMCSRWAPTTHTSIRQTGQETWIPQHMSLPHTAGATISRAQAVHTVCFASGKLFGQLLSCEAGFASMQTQHSTQPSPSDITLPRGGVQFQQGSAGRAPPRSAIGRSAPTQWFQAVRSSLTFAVFLGACCDACRPRVLLSASRRRTADTPPPAARQQHEQCYRL